MHELIKHLSQNAACMLRTRIMKILLDMGILEKTSEEKAKGLCTVMFTGE